MILCHESDIQNITYVINQAKSKEKSIISFDFDDTLYNHVSSISIKSKRNFLFSLIRNCKCLNIFPVIVSSRNEKLEEISNFCKKHEMVEKIRLVIHSVQHKPTVLKMIDSDIHFDDDIKVLSELYDYNLMGFLSSEWLNQNFYKQWIDTLDGMGHLKYFDIMHLERKEKLSTII